MNQPATAAPGRSGRNDEADPTAGAKPKKRGGPDAQDGPYGRLSAASEPVPNAVEGCEVRIPILV